MTTTTIPAVAPAKAEPAEKVSSAPKRDDRFRLLMIALFTAGGVLMPSGVIAVGLGWWGAAHSKYAYDQFPYLLSGGLLGVCLTTLGGFLYFGAWQAKVASDQKQAMKHLADAVLTLTDVVGRQAGGGGTGGSGADLVVAGTNGATVHRRDCGLIARREDLHPFTGDQTGLSRCRVCNPAPA